MSVAACIWRGDNEQAVREFLGDAAEGLSRSRIDNTRLVVRVDGARYRLPPGSEIELWSDSIVFNAPRGAAIEYRDHAGTGQSRPGASLAIIRPGH